MGIYFGSYICSRTLGNWYKRYRKENYAVAGSGISAEYPQAVAESERPPQLAVQRVCNQDDECRSQTESKPCSQYLAEHPAVAQLLHLTVELEENLVIVSWFHCD
jgi:hypothetical protein